MFKSIIFRVIQGRKLKPFATAKVLQEHEDRIKALEEGSSSDDTPLEKRDLTFTINDGTDPIEGATVTIGEVIKTTGSAGGCTFKDIEEGTHSVSVSKAGYTTKTEEITVSADDTAFTISLVQE